VILTVMTVFALLEDNKRFTSVMMVDAVSFCSARKPLCPKTPLGRLGNRELSNEAKVTSASAKAAGLLEREDINTYFL
jgi:hypothetical protein